MRGEGRNPGKGTTSVVPQLASTTVGFSHWGSLFQQRLHSALLFARRRIVTFPIQHPNIVILIQILPALQSYRHIAILPQEIIERPQAEFVPLRIFRIGKKTQNLILANLIADRLARRCWQKAPPPLPQSSGPWERAEPGNRPPA